MKTKFIFFLMLALATEFVCSQNLNDFNRSNGISYQMIHNFSGDLRHQPHFFHPVKQFFQLKQSPVDNNVVKYALDSTVDYSVGEDTTQLLADYKNEFEYDDYGKIIRSYHYVKGRSTGALTKFSMDEYEYNDNNQVTQQTGYLWQDEKGWKQNTREVITYFRGDVISRELYLKWNEEAQSWLNDSKQDYYYDDHTRITQTVQSEYDHAGESWVEKTKTEYLYLEGNDSTIENEKTTYTKDVSTGNWLNQYKYTNTFDITGKLDETTVFNWNSDNEIWNNMWKYRYLYNQNGIATDRITDMWDDENGWVQDTKSSYVFDQNQQLQQYIYYMWIAEAWSAMIVQAALFNDDYLFYQLLIPFYYTGCDNFNWFHHMLVKMSSYYHTSRDEVTLSYVTLYHYSEKDIIGNTPENLDDRLSVYPNPFRDKIHFKTSESGQSLLVEIYDMQGRYLTSETISSGNYLNLNNLKSGLYFYKINNSYSGKIVKY